MIMIVSLMAFPLPIKRVIVFSRSILEPLAHSIAIVTPSCVLVSIRGLLVCASLVNPYAICVSMCRLSSCQKGEKFHISIYVLRLWMVIVFVCGYVCPPCMDDEFPLPFSHINLVIDSVCVAHY